MALHVPKYREQLLHGDEQVRLGAADRLIALGRRPEAARPELLALFSDDSAEVSRRGGPCRCGRDPRPAR